MYGIKYDGLAEYPDIVRPDIDFCQISRYSVFREPDIRLNIRYPANPLDIRYPAILPDYPAGYLIILNKNSRLTHSVNFRFVPSYFT